MWPRSLVLLAMLASACGAMRSMSARGIVGPFGGDDAAREPGWPIEAIAADGTRLHGYVVRSAERPARGVIQLLHGQGESAAWWKDEALALAASGYDVAAWDNRGHGRSGGMCTFGARERGDVARELDALAAAGLDVSRTLLYGYSMGSVIAIQAAARDHRVRGVVAVAPFADVETVIRRVVWVAPSGMVRGVVEAAEERAGFRVGDIHIVDDARRLRVPLLIVTAEDDKRAPAEDAWRIARAAGGPVRVVAVPRGGHDHILDLCGPACDFALGQLVADAGLAQPAEPRRDVARVEPARTLAPPPAAAAIAPPPTPAARSTALRARGEGSLWF